MYHRIILILSSMFGLFCLFLQSASAKHSLGTTYSDPILSTIQPSQCIGISKSSDYWARSYPNSYLGGISSNDGGLILVRDDGVNDTILFKIDVSGNIIWQQIIRIEGEAGSDGYYVLETSDGGYILAGRIFSPTTDVNAIIIRLNASREIVWQKTITSESTTATETAFTAIETPDGGFLLSAETNFFGHGDYDSILYKLTNSGEIVWEKLYRGGTFERMIVLPDDSIILGGGTVGYGAGGNDAWVMNINLNGDIIWQKSYGGINAEYLADIKLTTDNYLLILANTNTFGGQNFAGLVIKIDLTGNVIWQKVIGDWYGDDQVSSILELTDGNYLIAGDLSSAFDNGGAWLFSLNPIGELLWQVVLDGKWQNPSIYRAGDGGIYIKGSYEQNSTSGIIKTSSMLEFCIPFKDSFGTIEDTSVSVSSTSTYSEDINFVKYIGLASIQEADVQSDLICPIIYSYLPITMKYYSADTLFPNGNFELGPIIWKEYSNMGYQLIVQEFPDGIYPYDGTWVAWIGGDYNEQSNIEQQILVPINNPYLSYWHWTDSTESECSFDFETVAINGYEVYRNYLCMSNNTGGWSNRVMDLRSYAGQIIDLQFWSSNDDLNVTNIFIDHVAFQSSLGETTNLSRNYDLNGSNQLKRDILGK